MIKLLYVWINEDDSGFISQQGFSFSVEHRFALSVGHGDAQNAAARETYLLEYEYHPEAPDLWRIQDGSEHDGQIAGLTALVGENGTGKTSLLRYLYTLLPEEFYVPGDKQRDRRPNGVKYAAFRKERSRKDSRLSAYDIDGTIHVFHTFPTDTFAFPRNILKGDPNTPDICVHALCELAHEDRYHALLFLSRQSTVYFSNSLYTPELWDDWDEGPVFRICLTPAAMSHVAKRFYSGITLSRRPHHQELFSAVQNLLIHSLGMREWQQLCDVCYYHEQKKRLEQPGNIGRRSRRLTVAFARADELFSQYDELVEQQYRQGEISGDWFRAELGEQSSKIRRFKRQWTDFPPEVKANAFCVLCGSVLLEMCCACDLDLPEGAPDGPEGYLKILYEKFGEYCDEYENRREGIRTLRHSLRHLDEGDYREYYRIGLEEIDILWGILSAAQGRFHAVSRGDGGYKPGYTLAFDAEHPASEESRLYCAFCEAVDRFVSASSSVVLKYLRIEEHFSSGERALQNMFSWLNWVTRKGPDRYFSLRRNVLLMIDEVDLYMHPEWQRRSLQVLREELAAQHGARTVQLLISTHSPLVLSDVPLQNTIYLLRNGDKLTLAERGTMPQTFGANIHNLLREAFFLNNTLGACAYQLIDGISRELQRLRILQERLNEDGGREAPRLRAELSRLRERCLPYRDKIELIGEPLLRRQLLLLYGECFPDAADHSESRRLQELRSELLSIREQASDLPPAPREQLRRTLERMQALLDDLWRDT